MTGPILTLHGPSRDVLDSLEDVKRVKRLLDRAILATPTGADRAQLTEANIHLLVCESKLQSFLMAGTAAG